MVPDNMDALEWLRKHVEAKGSDLLCEMVRTFAERLMAAEVDTLCNAGYGEVRPERTNSRNGYRSRQLDSRVGSVDLSIPKLREGSYFPGWLLEPRRRTGRALLAVVAECYVRGVSTRRVEGLVQTLGIESLSKSQVSRMAGELDSEVAGFRNRPSMAASGHRPHLRALHLDLHLRTIDVAFSVRTTPRGTWPRMAEERVRR